jgi:hypothetical protein
MKWNPFQHFNESVQTTGVVFARVVAFIRKVPVSNLTLDTKCTY